MGFCFILITSEEFLAGIDKSVQKAIASVSKGMMPRFRGFSYGKTTSLAGEVVFIIGNEEQSENLFSLCPSEPISSDVTARDIAYICRLIGEGGVF